MTIRNEEETSAFFAVKNNVIILGQQKCRMENKFAFASKFLINLGQRR